MRRFALAVLAAAALLACVVPGAQARSLWGEITSFGDVQISRTDWTWTKGAAALTFNCSTYDFWDRAQQRWVKGPSTFELPVGSSGGAWCKKAGVSDIAEEFVFAIDDGSYVLYGSVSTPFLGDNQVHCEIRRKGTATPARDAPYICTAVWQQPDNIDDPRPAFTVERRGVQEVTDPATQRALFKQVCIPSPGQCHFEEPKLSETVSKPADTVWLVGPFANCGTQDAEVAFSHAVSTSATTSLDATLKGGLEFFEFFKVEITAKVGKEWESSHEYVSSQSFSIEAGDWGGLQLVPAVDVVTGDVEIITSSTLYRLKDVRIELPPRSYQRQGSFPGRTKVVGGEAGIRCPKEGRTKPGLRRIRSVP